MTDLLTEERGFSQRRIEAIVKVVPGCRGRAVVERVSAGLAEIWVECEGEPHQRVFVEIRPLSALELDGMAAVLADDAVALALSEGNVAPSLRDVVLADQDGGSGETAHTRCSCGVRGGGLCAHAVSALAHLLVWLPDRLDEQLRWLGVRTAQLDEVRSRGVRLAQEAAWRMWSATEYYGDGPIASAPQREEPRTAPAPLTPGGLVHGGRDVAAWVDALIRAALDPELRESGERPPADAAGASVPPNRWCAVLDMEPPSPEAVLAAKRNVKLRDLMIVALLERGTPASFEELAMRLRLAGAARLARRADLEASLRKAWKATLPFYRTLSGRYALDVHCFELRSALGEVDLGPHARRRAALLEADADRETAPSDALAPGPDGPLTAEEVDAALERVSLTTFSVKRAFAALLDAAGEPLTVETLAAQLKELGVHHFDERKALERLGDDLVELREGGKLALSPNEPAVAAMRIAVRRRALPRIQRLRRAEQGARDAEEGLRAYHERVRARALAPSPPSRGVLHFTGEPDAPELAVVVDCAARTTRVLPAPDARTLRSALEPFDELAGFRIHGPAEWTGLVDEKRVIELMPEGQTARSPEGRKVSLDPARILRATLQLPSPRSTRAGPIRVLEQEALRHAALLRFGLLHDGVCAALGHSRTMLHVWWASERDPRLSEILSIARAEQRPLDLVLGGSFDPGDPFARPWAVTVANRAGRSVVCRAIESGLEAEVDVGEIIDVRWASQAPPA